MQSNISRAGFTTWLDKCVACTSTRVELWFRRSVDHDKVGIYRCNDCDTAFLNPQPTIDYLRQYIYTAQEVPSSNACYLDLDAKQLLAAYAPAAEDAITSIRHLLSYDIYTRPITLLDIGAGYGLYCLEAQKQGFDATGINPKGHESTIFREQFPNIELIDGTFEDVDLNGRKFSAILGNHVLEHTVSPRDFVAKAAAHLTQNGVLAIAVPNVNWLLTLLAKEHDWALNNPEHLSFFSIDGLRRLIQAGGLRIVRVDTSTYFPFNSLRRRLGIGGSERYYWSVWRGQQLVWKAIDHFGKGLVARVWAIKE